MAVAVWKWQRQKRTGWLRPHLHSLCQYIYVGGEASTVVLLPFPSVGTMTSLVMERGRLHWQWVCCQYHCIVGLGIFKSFWL